MASSSSQPHITVDVEEQYPYPYPSHVYTPSFVTLKLSGKDKYSNWRTQMICLLRSHDMFGFVDGTIQTHRSSVSGKEKVGDQKLRLWTRSDSLVKGWILGSLSEQTLTFVLNNLTNKLQQQKTSDFSAKDLWDELQTIYAPAAQAQLLPQVPVVDNQEEEIRKAEIHQELCEATLSEDWDRVTRILRGGVKVIDKITYNGNTTLHVAVATTNKPQFLEELLGETPGDTQLLDVRNSDGSTLLHVAAIMGNSEAAKILIERNRDLLLAKDNEGQTPLALALSNMQTKTARHIVQHINTDVEKDALFSGKCGDELLVTAISSNNFGLANDLVNSYTKLDSDVVLTAIAQNFPRELTEYEKSIAFNVRRIRFRGVLNWRSVLNWRPVLNWETVRRSASEILMGVATNFMNMVPLNMFPNMGLGTRLSYPGIAHPLFFLSFSLKLLLQLVVWLLIRARVQNYNDAHELLRKVCKLIKDLNDPNSYHHYYTNPIFEATRQNACKVVEEIVSFFPNAIWSANKDGHNILQCAVINRSEKVYNLLYQNNKDKNIYRTITDSSGCNLLHLAARLAPTNKLNRISGAALHIQSELQWFKEIRGFVCPININQKNSLDETPQMVFTREHKEMVIEGEKWMKATSESYTITAALITTIVFAAAITVPGGSDQVTGIPIFSNRTVFIVFAISDAISLFAAVTSLLVFLSILTARFAEQDFLFKLPTKLIIGLATLFISTTAMMVAFGATLYIVFGQRNSRILVAIIVMTCLPIISFLILQLHLILDLMRTTCGGTIFGKNRDALSIFVQTMERYLQIGRTR